MSRIQPPRAYCGAPPPEGRTTASCVLGTGEHREHRNLDGLRWSSEADPKPEPEQVRLWGPWPGKPGPVHRTREDADGDLSWCGSRAQFRHRHWTGDAAAVTCKPCLRRLALGSPLSFGARA